MNKCIFTGRLTKEPKYLGKTEEEAAFLAYTLAVTNGYGDSAKTFFINCTALGNEADKQKKKLYKGVKVIVEGELYCYTSNAGDDKVALSVKDCDIVQHTKAYMEKHQSEIESLRKAEIERATQKKKLDVKKDKDGKVVRDWYNDESDYYDKKKSKYGIQEDEDGFMQIEEDDCILPFD